MQTKSPYLLLMMFIGNSSPAPWYSGRSVKLTSDIHTLGGEAECIQLYTLSWFTAWIKRHYDVSTKKKSHLLYLLQRNEHPFINSKRNFNFTRNSFLVSHWKYQTRYFSVDFSPRTFNIFTSIFHFLNPCTHFPHNWTCRHRRNNDASEEVWDISSHYAMRRRLHSVTSTRLVQNSFLAPTVYLERRFL
jgi:hypothetical protein